MSKSLGIILIGNVKLSFAKFLQEEILKHIKIFQKTIIVEKVEKIPEKSYDSIRGQYLSTHFLNIVANNVNKYKFFKAIGITDVDLFVPSLNFVFGVARNDDCVISIHRLYSEFYGDAPDHDMFLIRMLKEAIHELGHTLGLNHCTNKCIMCFSNSISDTDAKPVDFCAKCVEKIANFYCNRVT